MAYSRGSGRLCKYCRSEILEYPVMGGAPSTYRCPNTRHCKSIAPNEFCPVCKSNDYILYVQGNSWIKFACNNCNGTWEKKGGEKNFLGYLR